MPTPTFHFFYKTFHVHSGATYYGIHESYDPFFGSPGAIDQHRGDGKKLKALIAKCGGGAFITQVISAGTKEQCRAALENVRDRLDYSHPLCLNDPPVRANVDRLHTPEVIKKRREIAKKSLKGNTNTLNKRTKKKKGYHTRKALLKHFWIDESKVNKKTHTIKWCHNPNTKRDALCIVKKGTAIGVPRNYVLGKWSKGYRIRQKQKKLEKLYQNKGLLPKQLPLFED